jgi:hypothetical protein
MRISLVKKLLIVIFVALVLCVANIARIKLQYHMMCIDYYGGHATQGIKSNSTFFVKMDKSDTYRKLTSCIDSINNLSQYGLVEIDLSHSDIKNEELNILTILQGKVVLNLRDTKVDAEALATFANIKQLSGVYVDESQISQEKMRQFWSSRPAKQ